MKEKPIEITAADCFARRRKEFTPVVIDLRSREDYDAGHLPGARWIDPREWNFFLDDLQQLSILVFYDDEGSEKAMQAATWARGRGFRGACIVTGGYKALQLQMEEDSEVLAKIPESEWRTKIESLFDGQIRPVLEADGGGAEIVDISSEVLKIRYLGACTTCSGGAEGTLQLIDGFIQNWLNHRFDIQIVA